MRFDNRPKSPRWGTGGLKRPARRGREQTYGDCQAYAGQSRRQAFTSALFLAYRNSRKISIAVRNRVAVDARGYADRDPRRALSGMPGFGVAYTSVGLLLVLVSTAMGDARSLCKSERAQVRLPRLPFINTKPIKAGARESAPAHTTP